MKANALTTSIVVDGNGNAIGTRSLFFTGVSHVEADSDELDLTQDPADYDALGFFIEAGVDVDLFEIAAAHEESGDDELGDGTTGDVSIVETDGDVLPEAVISDLLDDLGDIFDSLPEPGVRAKLGVRARARRDEDRNWRAACGEANNRHRRIVWTARRLVTVRGAIVHTIGDDDHVLIFPHRQH